MRYVLARFDTEDFDKTYRFFIAESLRLSPQGKYIAHSLMDMFREEEEVNGDAIVENIFEKAGLSFEE